MTLFEKKGKKKKRNKEKLNGKHLIWRGRSRSPDYEGVRTVLIDSYELK